MQSQSLSNTQFVAHQHLLIETDTHNSIHLKITSPSVVQSQIFQSKILQLQQKQKNHSYRAIWIHLNQPNLSFIQYLLKKDYVIHRGYKSDVSLYKWTGNFSDCVPKFSRIFIGCGAMLLKDNHVFLVQQKSGDRKGLFGLPGGRADPGEFISEATQRELFEQTGLKGKFEYVVYFRQHPKSLWNAFDVYFVSILTVQQKEYQNLKLCQNQIASYKWVHLSQYGDFMQKNGSPSQIHVGKHVSDLYKKGLDFNKKGNITVQKPYKQGSDIRIMQHYVTGVDLLENK